MQKNWYWAAVGLLFAALAYFSTDKLIETPPTWFDEGVLVQVAMNDSRFDQEAIQTAPGTLEKATYVTGGFSFLKPVSWSFDIFGTGLLQARSVMVFFILAAALAFFALLYSLHGRLAALSGLALLVTFPPLYGQGKNVLGEVPGLFFFAAFLYALQSIEKNGYRGALRYLLAGALAGLTFATKPIFILILPAIFAALLLQRKSIRFDWPLIAVALLSFAVPVLLWYTGRFAVSDSFSQLLTYYANPYTIADIPSQISANMLRFFTEAAPAYFAILMGIWTLSVGLRAYRKERISLAETTAFAFALLVSLAYLRTPGWYRYFFLAEIPALMFAPYALMRLSLDAAAKYRHLATAGVWIILATFLVLQLYQLFVGSWVAQHAARTTARDIAAYMATLPPDETYFIYNMPASAIFLPSKNYYQYLELNDKVHLGEEHLDLLRRGVPRYLVTDDARWRIASSTMTRYRIIGTVESLIVAESVER